MLREIVRVDQDVIKVYYHINVQKIREDVIHKVLEGSWNVGETKKHNVPFEGIIASPGSCFLFVAFCDPDKMVCVPEIYLHIYTDLPWGIEEVCYKWNQIIVFLCNVVEDTEIHTEA